MQVDSQFVSAVPVLASLDIERSLAFFCTHLAFECVHAEPGGYGIVSRGPVEIHFWACADRRIAENTGCRIEVRDIESLFAKCLAAGIVHPNAALTSKPWNAREFAILDPDGNCVTFFEWDDA